jgi:outer membrane murein-binding lipoprotein Lpp
MRRVTGLLALAGACALVAAGCGGESSAKKKEEFLTKANSICRHFEGLQNDVQVPSVNPLAAKTSHAARAQWGLGINQLAYLGTQEVNELSKLKPPKELADDFQQLLATKSGAFRDLMEGADAAKRNHISEIKAPINAGRAALAQATKQARALGLKDCE